MFDIAWSELIIIAVVALIVIGPKELPGVLRGIGHWMGKIRRMASEFQGQFQEAMREAEVADLKKQVDDLSTSASDLTNFNPMAEAQKELDSAFEAADRSLDAPKEVSKQDSTDTSPPPEPSETTQETERGMADAVPEKKAGSGA
ncbi:MAG: Sec-independent protein translocase protein TatB [Pseudolabrys sp.]